MRKSSATIIFRLLTLSATIPPTGDSSTMGRKAQAVTAPYSAEEPVLFNRYSGSAKRSAALPNREIIWPMTTSVKSFENNFCFITYTSMFSLYIPHDGMYKC